MNKVKYLVLGAGPAGLTFANKLVDRNETSFLVVEKEKVAGGLCRSVEVDNSPLDIGGGHFLDVKRPEVTEYLFRFMPREEWKLFERDSRIDLNGNEVAHPLEANIWQLPKDIQNEYLESIKNAGCNQNKPIPEKFVDWIFWKLGDKIALDYMIPYNQKMFADELNRLGTYWLEKLPNVDYEDTIKSCEEHHAYAKQPGHAQFYYPSEYGYGEVWLRMAQRLGDNIIYDTSVTIMNLNNHTVILSNGETIEADIIVSTIPWNSIKNIEGLLESTKEDLKKLVKTEVEIRYVKDNLNNEAQWIYVPDINVPYHRILNRRVFCTNSNGYWTETRGERTSMFDESDDSFRYVNEYAYPLNTIEKPAIMDNLLNELKRFNVYGLGRWGEHSHHNSDVVVEKAIRLSEQI